ncbi:MAG: adenosine kinase [Alphaproteobacteria bacterium]
MSEPTLGLVAVGNALVDILAPASEEFIVEQKETYGMEKGAMTLIEKERATELYNQIGPAIESSGGSAANTMAGFASFGGTGGFIGKVSDDILGKIFKHDLRSMGVTFNTPPLPKHPPTGRCIILVTPDAQRTMNTFLGASVELDENDIDRDLVASGAITYLEGYLFDKEKAMKAFYKAAEYAHEAGRKVALTLSDPFCVARHREAFIRLVDKHVDILFANEEEIKSLYQTQTFEEAVNEITGHCEIAALTRSAKGAVIVSKGKKIEIPPHPVERVVDTTGAGDQFAAGFLYGMSLKMSVDKCGLLGSMAAAEVISHMGPRPGKKLSKFLAAA